MTNDYDIDIDFCHRNNSIRSALGHFFNVLLEYLQLSVNRRVNNEISDIVAAIIDIVFLYQFDGTMIECFFSSKRESTSDSVAHDIGRLLKLKHYLSWLIQVMWIDFWCELIIDYWLLIWLQSVFPTLANILDDAFRSFQISAATPSTKEMWKR